MQLTFLCSETNLKIKQAEPDLQTMFSSLAAVSAAKCMYCCLFPCLLVILTHLCLYIYTVSLDCEGPTLNLYNFEGTFNLATKKVPLGKDQILLRVRCAVWLGYLSLFCVMRCDVL